MTLMAIIQQCYDSPPPYNHFCTGARIETKTRLTQKELDAEENSVASLYREVSQAAWLGLIVNLLLGIVKLIGGIVGHSFALIADAVNSIGDVVTTVIVLFALHVAQRPADENIRTVTHEPRPSQPPMWRSS